MSKIFEIRTKLKVCFSRHITLSINTGIQTDTINDTLKSLNHGELSIAVVGEIKRGKSTFLNALLGAKVFPAQATICTAGVTILDNGDKPEAEIIYKDKKPVRASLSMEEPAKGLIEIVSRKNQNAKDIQLVRVWYPNKFTGNGIVLVDTPGVNDPEYWREEITYSYLASADAVIMLLDPMQPLSKSEIDFLDNKILGRSISNLIFVVNKIDDVTMAERESALNRIRKLLSQHVPNPVFFSVASKPALQAKMSNDNALLGTTGFIEFERALLDFLAKGRGGLLLRTKLEKAMCHLASIEDSINRRTAALDTEKDEVETELKNSSKKLDDLEKNAKEMLSDIKSRQMDIRRKIDLALSYRNDHLHSTVIPAITSEGNEEILRQKVHSFQRDTIQQIQEAFHFELNTLLGEFGNTSTKLEGEIRNVLNQFDQYFETATDLVQIERRPVTYRSSGESKKTAGAIAGGIAGGAVGMAAASSITTTTITAVGTLATTAAIGTAGIIGIGILTGGLGLLVGLGVAALLSDKSKDQQPQPKYINDEDFVNNQRTAQALNQFIDNLKQSIPNAVQGILNIAIFNIVKPVETEITAQRELIKQMKDDLKKTMEEQSETRKLLASFAIEATEIRNSYNDIYKIISGI